MEDTIQIVSGSMVYIGSGIQVMLKLLPQQFERLRCWHY
jgi:hypothetical protein